MSKPRSINDTEIHTWFERDRAHVELRDKRTDKTLVEWWDEDVTNAVEDGFLNPRDYHGSAWDYYRDVLAPQDRRAIKRNPKMKRNPIGKHRTTVGQDDGMTCVRYHATNVVCFDAQKIILRSGGWLTATTKKRMNQAAQTYGLGFSVSQKRGDWFVTLRNGNVLPFSDGMTIHRAQTNPSPRARAFKRTRRELEKWHKKTGKVPSRQAVENIFRRVRKTGQVWSRANDPIKKNPRHNLQKNDRIQMAPHTDWFMRGARYGNVTKVGANKITVKLDKLSRAIQVHPDSVMLVDEAFGWKRNPHKRSSKKPLSAKQAAWRKKFAAMVRAGKFRKAKKNPKRKKYRHRFVAHHPMSEFAARPVEVKGRYQFQKRNVERIRKRKGSGKLSRFEMATLQRSHQAMKNPLGFDCHIAADFTIARKTVRGYYTGKTFDTRKSHALLMSKKTAMQSAQSLSRRMRRPMIVGRG